MTWLWIWLIFVFVFLLAPIGYGYGYRRWGPPYPSWTRRARDARAQRIPTWGILADFIWLMLMVAIVWFLVIALFY